MRRSCIAIIPAYKPSSELIQLVNILIENSFDNIIVVNDGSDNSYDNIFNELLSRLQVTILRHHTNQGKGRALKTAFNHVLINYRDDYNGVITIDADGQHKIKDILACVNALEEKTFNGIVLGCRQFSNAKSIPLRSKFGNLCTRYVLRYLCGINISDSQTGLRAIPMDLLPMMMKTSGEKYEYETNVLLEIVNSDRKIAEIPIEAVYENNNSSSHFNPIKDSIKIYTVILKYSMASFIAALLDNLTFFILSFYLTNIWLMTFIGRLVAALINFSMNRRIVFKKHGNIWLQGSKYIALVFCSGCISAFIVSMLTSKIAIPIIGVKLFVETILYFINFSVQKNCIFINTKNE